MLQSRRVGKGVCRNVENAGRGVRAGERFQDVRSLFEALITTSRLYSLRQGSLLRRGGANASEVCDYET